ncbi:hypothetical protein B0J15DRAFT_129860 [Fusarium solani]|uniref:Uncharacterized protein n=1 Tax=Fusarium solani TaxID=169388 RepID=A0A9P9RCY9_FUSSL|nr:uncharacterized protein B0J15DRAFT_129860 [Fusarium solani]KAH7274447.1 hypothetical protein B0J15DRAFT_129860 [Fusarium solani]
MWVLLDPWAAWVCSVGTVGYGLWVRAGRFGPTRSGSIVCCKTLIKPRPLALVQHCTAPAQTKSDHRFLFSLLPRLKPNAPSLEPPRLVCSPSPSLPSLFASSFPFLGQDKYLALRLLHHTKQTQQHHPGASIDQHHHTTW